MAVVVAGKSNDATNLESRSPTLLTSSRLFFLSDLVTEEEAAATVEAAVAATIAAVMEVDEVVDTMTEGKSIRFV
jgi:hypothetical protein